MAITESKLREIIKEECELTVEKQRLRNIIKEEYQAVLSEQSIESFFPNFEIPPAIKAIVQALPQIVAGWPQGKELDWEGKFFPMVERILGGPLEEENKKIIKRVWEKLMTYRDAGALDREADTTAQSAGQPQAGGSWVGKSMRDVVKIVKAELKKLGFTDKKMRTNAETRANQAADAAFKAKGKPYWFWGGLLKLRNKHPLRRKYKEWYQDYRKKRRAKRKRR